MGRALDDERRRGKMLEATGRTISTGGKRSKDFKKRLVTAVGLDFRHFARFADEAREASHISLSCLILNTQPAHEFRLPTARCAPATCARTQTLPLARLCRFGDITHYQ